MKNHTKSSSITNLAGLFCRVGSERHFYACAYWKPYLENTFWLKEEPKKGKGISPATESINKHNRIFSGL